ncbi:MAG: hypothetical protein PWP04_328 [Candidatus Atribacteria bacterium]|nr:hypothetical protein [Candidatus Atribacteria bacterium]
MGYIHIVGGEVKGRKIVAPSEKGVRPAQGFLRKAIFDIIRSDIQGKVVVDLFAGSGSLGLEALSRGAEKAYFLEKESRVCRIIKSNIDRCGFSNRAEVIKIDFLRTKNLPQFADKIDFLFCDPPFAQEPGKVLAKIYNFKVVFDQSLIIIRFLEGRDLADCRSFFRFEDIRQYGKSVIAFGFLV